MYLKSLKLVGFKSFADRTRLEFRHGVTVVVGPNGSGKSNLVDALSWVLGTQSNKSMRTQKMEDVIFAGTATRPAMGRAEATLVIDNTERQIDLDLDEVSITRRLYRDGSSDYELNGVGCRLLDIQDLLSDSGVGRHQHVIIGQGEIGRILNASAEEHRAVIEEAAGILKHRRRKERSERRLERTDEDVLRLQDLLGEIERQLRPLRRQAKAAERYDGLKAEVTALQLHLGGSKLALLDRELTIATSERSALSEQIEVDTRQIGTLTDRVTELSGQAEEAGSALEAATSAAALLETTMERLRRIGSIASERGRAASGRRLAFGERRADLEEELSHIAEELAVTESERRSAETATSSAEARFRRLEDEERSLATQNSLAPEGALAAIRGELSSIESSLARDQREFETIDRRLDVLTSQIDREQQEIDRINDEIRVMDVDLSGLQKDYDRASASRAARQKTWSDAERDLEVARISSASAQARLEAMREAVHRRFDPESRGSVERSGGALGSLASQLDIPDGLEAAVGAALGEWADAIAFIDADSVRAALSAVKAVGGGSISMVSSMSYEARPAVEVATSMGLDALVDLLGPNAHPNLAARLLGDVILVEGWSAGWSLIAKHPALRAVTPDGDLISVAGARVKDPEGAGTALLESAEVAVEQTSTVLARAESIHTSAKRDFERSREAERQALESLERAEATMAGLSEAMDRLQVSVRTLLEEAGRLEVRREALTEAIESASNQIGLLSGRLAAIEGEEAERLRIWDEMESRRVRVSVDRESSRSEWQEAATSLRAIVERRRLLQDRVGRIEEELARLGPPTDEETDPDRLAAVGEVARRAVSIVGRRVEELRDRQAALRTRRDELRRELADARDQHQARGEATSSARRRAADLDVRITETRMRRESVLEAIRRDTDRDVDQAINAPRPGFAGDDVDLEELLEEKSAQLRRLGPINPLAAREYHDLEERHTFLLEQMADVESSRAELRKVIRMLEEEIQSRFERAFTEVAESYQRYFDVLFPGGRGRIRLADPEDPRSGVLIDAQPLGKKVSQMTLLSGGERSLAALAFLFAVFEARPSPFYVLDEVEAALDDANLRRFIRIVDEFRQRAQLIIVTHQQQTMVAADVLYGITIEPGGSSQAVRKDMTMALTTESGA